MPERRAGCRVRRRDLPGPPRRSSTAPGREPRRTRRTSRSAGLRIVDSSPAARSLSRGVLPHGLEQSVPGRVTVRLGDHQRRVDKPAESAEGPRLAEIVGAHPLDRLQRERSGEHRQPSEEHPLVVGEQVMAPGQGGRQRLLTGDRCPASSAEQRERVAEACGDLLRREHRDTRRSELQRQRHTVEAITDLRHRSGVVVGRARIRATAADARRTNSCNEATPASASADGMCSGSGTAREGVSQLTSPSMRNGSRLVARMETSGQPCSSSVTVRAHASIRCSQLSSTMRRCSAAQLRHQRVDRSLTSQPAEVPAPLPPPPRSAHRRPTPPARRETRRRDSAASAGARARPRAWSCRHRPGPVRVSIRALARIRAVSSSSRRRPTSSATRDRQVRRARQVVEVGRPGVPAAVGQKFPVQLAGLPARAPRRAPAAAPCGGVRTAPVPRHGDPHLRAPASSPGVPAHAAGWQRRQASARPRRSAGPVRPSRPRPAS